MAWVSRLEESGPLRPTKRDLARGVEAGVPVAVRPVDALEPELITVALDGKVRGAIVVVAVGGLWNLGAVAIKIMEDN